MMHGYDLNDVTKTGYGEYRCIAWRGGKLCFTARGRTESESQQNVLILIKGKDSVNGQRRAGAGENERINQQTRKAVNPPKSEKCVKSPTSQHSPPLVSPLPIVPIVTGSSLLTSVEGIGRL
jgi:hypothetical protein